MRQIENGCVFAINSVLPEDVVETCARLIRAHRNVQDVAQCPYVYTLGDAAKRAEGGLHAQANRFPHQF